MRQKNCLTLFVALASFSCGTAPKIVYCIPGSPTYGCSNGEMPKEKAGGMICTDSRDQRTIIRACKLGIGIPETLEICVVNPGGDNLACSSGNVIPAYGGAKNFVCTSENDLDRLLVWCKRNKK